MAQMTLNGMKRILGDFFRMKNFLFGIVDMFHVYGTMPIGFLVKFYPILTPHTCL